MLLRALGAATAATLVVALAPTAALAATPTYKVSISASKTKADVGQTVRVSGKVAGPSAAKKVLLVQRRVGAGAWKTISKVRTSKKRAYSRTVKVTTAGKQQLRVVAPKSKKAKQGVSAARALTGWRWLDAAASAAIDGLTRRTVTIQGGRYTSLAPAPDEAGIMFVRTDGTCDTLSYSLGAEGTVDEVAILTVLQFRDDAYASSTSVAQKLVSGGNAPLSATWPLRADTRNIMVAVNSDSAGTGHAALIAPRLHCSVNRLAKAAVPVG